MSSKPGTKRIKAAMGFELSPARCMNCKAFKPAMHGVPERHPYKHPKCSVGGFIVKPSSICDKWESTEGEVLE